MMVIDVPVKFEFDWTNRFRIRVRKGKCGQTDGWTEKQIKTGQTNGQNYTNVERNLAMMVIYVHVKFEFDWTNRFQVRVREKNVDRQTDGQKDGQKTDKWTNEWTELHQFRKEPSYEGDLCPCQV